MTPPSSANKRVTSNALGYRMLAILAILYARTSQMFLCVMAGMGDFVIGILEASLNTDEKQALTLRLYDTASEKYAISSGLFFWESAWYDEALPPAPGRILITAAGRGREVKALLERGYLVHAAEPVSKFAAECAALPGIGDFFKADHDDIVQAVLTGKGPAAEIYGNTYDAVIVGWGSFAHMMDDEQRRRFLNACHALAPEGPILLSFFADLGQPMPETRAMKVGRTIGRHIARWRNVISTIHPNDVFLWHAGFFHRYPEHEMEEFAKALGRGTIYRAEPYGHATLLPPTQQLSVTDLRHFLKSYNL